MDNMIEIQVNFKMGVVKDFRVPGNESGKYLRAKISQYMRISQSSVVLSYSGADEGFIANVRDEDQIQKVSSHIEVSLKPSIKIKVNIRDHGRSFEDYFEPTDFTDDIYDLLYSFLEKLKSIQTSSEESRIESKINQAEPQEYTLRFKNIKEPEVILVKGKLLSDYPFMLNQLNELEVIVPKTHVVINVKLNLIDKDYVAIKLPRRAKAVELRKEIAKQFEQLKGHEFLLIHESHQLSEDDTYKSLEELEIFDDSMLIIMQTAQV